MNKYIERITVFLLILILTAITLSCSIPKGIKTTSSNVISSKPTVCPGDTTIISASSLMVQFTLDDMIKSTEAAIIGKVVEILPAKKLVDQLGKSIIYTDVIINPERYIYGEPQADRIVVRVDEGRVGSMIMINEDEPEFILGEECAVFLVRPSYKHIVPDIVDDLNYYVSWAGLGGKYEIKDSILIDFTGKEIALSEVEQIVASVRGE